MSELVSEVGSESFPVLTLEDQLAKCRYSFEYPITDEETESGRAN